MRRLLPPTLLAAAVLTAGRVDAATVADGEDLAISLDTTRICVVVPSGLRDEKACAGFTVQAPAESTTGGGPRLIAQGAMRIEGDVAILKLVRTGLTMTQPDRPAADRIVAGVVRAEKKWVEASASVEARDTHLLTIGRTNVIRTTLFVGGSGSGRDGIQTAHRAYAIIPAERATYTMQFIGSARAGRELEAELDSALATLVVRPAPPRSTIDASEKAERLGSLISAVSIIVPTILIAAAAAVALVVQRRAARARRRR